MKKMSNKQYVNTYGTKCPACRHQELEPGPLTWKIDKDPKSYARVYVQLTCNRCKSIWEEQYNLKSYELLENKEDQCHQDQRQDL